MKPSRPYLLRALYEWVLDSELTPYLVVNAEWPDVVVPQQFVENGQIVLNINPSAVRDFMIEDQALFFNARFSGQPMDVYVPMGAVMAIYAMENAEGMGFGVEPGAELYRFESVEKPAGPVAVESESSGNSQESGEASPVSEASEPESVKSDASKDDAKAQADKSPKKGPVLRVVK